MYFKERQVRNPNGFIHSDPSDHHWSHLPGLCLSQGSPIWLSRELWSLAQVWSRKIIHIFFIWSAKENTKYFYQHNKSGIVLADIGWCSVSSPWWSWCWTSWSTPCRTPSPAIWSSSAASWPGAWLQSSGMAATSSSTMWVSNCDAVKRLLDASTSLVISQFCKMFLLIESLSYRIYWASSLVLKRVIEDPVPIVPTTS